MLRLCALQIGICGGESTVRQTILILQIDLTVQGRNILPYGVLMTTFPQRPIYMSFVISQQFPRLKKLPRTCFFTYSVSRFPPTAFPSSENAMGEMARAATVSHSAGVRADTLNSAASGGTVMTVSWSAAHRAAQTVSFRFEKMPMLKTERRERILNE